MSLFQKKIEPHCSYCTHGRPLGNDEVACPKKGVMSGGSSCSAFRYDPFKRVPPRPVQVDFGQLKDEDFSLD